MSKKQDQKLKTEVKGIIVESIHEALNDPEYGKELQGWVKKRLKKYDEEKDASTFIPAGELNE